MSEESDSRELMALVGKAADHLLDDLRSAQAATNDWAHEERTRELVAQSLDRCLTELSNSECWGEANRLPSDILWQRTREYLESGMLQVRAREKPRGYAGDYRMLEQICRHEVCDHPLGRAFDHYFQSQAAPESVRQRTQLIARWIVERVRKSPIEATRVISIGSGPAIDVELAVSELSAEERMRLNVTLVDLDPEALEAAHTRLSALLDAQQVQAHRENLGRLPKNARALARLGQGDMAICSGYFDYLDAPSAVTFLQAMRGLTAVNGETIVFNFATENSSRAYMEWVGNWYLIYRTRGQLAEIARESGFETNQFEIATEPAETSIYLRAVDRS